MQVGEIGMTGKVMTLYEIRQGEEAEGQGKGASI